MWRFQYLAYLCVWSIAFFIFQQFLNACDTERVSLHSLNSPDVVNGSCLLLGSTLRVRMRQWEVEGFCFPCLAGVPRIWGGAFSAFLPCLPLASILCFIFVEVLGCKRVPCPSPTSSRPLLCRVLGPRELLLLPQMGWILLIALLQKQWTFTWALGMGVLPPSLYIWLLLYVRYRSRKLQSTPALAAYIPALWRGFLWSPALYPTYLMVGHGKEFASECKPPLVFLGHLFYLTLHADTHLAFKHLLKI